MNPSSPNTQSPQGDALALLDLCLILVVCLALAAIIACNPGFQRDQHADSLIPILVSLQHWTVFYWEQDRYGMALPLLASGIKSPFLNLLFQSWISVFCGLACYFVLARYLIWNVFWPIPAALCVVVMLTLAPTGLRFEWFCAQPYALSLFLGVGGLLLVDAQHYPTPAAISLTRLVCGVTSLILAQWVNFAVVLPICILIIADYLLARCRSGNQAPARTTRQLGFQMLITGLGFCANQILVHAVKIDGQGPVRSFAPHAEWLQAWLSFSRSTSAYLVPSIGPLTIVLASCLVLMSLVLVGLRKTADVRGGSRLPASIIAAIASWLVVGASTWVKANFFLGRYALPSLFFAEVPLATLVTLPWLSTFGRGPATRPLVVALCVVTLMAGTAVSYGHPSVAKTREVVAQSSREISKEIVAAKADLVAGSYWRVWPAVFATNMALYDLGSGRRVFGLAFRGKPSSSAWQASNKQLRKVAAPPNDKEVGWSLSQFGLCAGRFETVGEIAVAEAHDCH